MATDGTVIDAARTAAGNEGVGYQTVINNTLRHALLDADQQEQNEPVQMRNGITAADLNSLEKKPSAAVGEIRRVLEPGAKP